MHHVVAIHCCVEERSKYIVALGRWYHQRPIVIVLYWCYWLLCQPLNRLKIRSMLRLFDEYSKHALALVVVEHFDRFPFSYSNKQQQEKNTNQFFFQWNSISVKVLNEWLLSMVIVKSCCIEKVKLEFTIRIDVYKQQTLKKMSILCIHQVLWSESIF